MDLYELNRRVNAQENIVGWWATGNEVWNKIIYEYLWLIQIHILINVFYIRLPIIPL